MRRATRLPAKGRTVVIAFILSLILLAVLALSASGPPAAVAAGSPCTLPGVNVVTVPSGDNDSALVTQFPQVDIQSVSIAELGTDTNKLSITLKVMNLNLLALQNTLLGLVTWRTSFVAPNGTRYYVAMYANLSPPTPPTFDYGTLSGGVATSLGTPDAATFS